MRDRERIGDRNIELKILHLTDSYSKNENKKKKTEQEMYLGLDNADLNVGCLYVMGEFGNSFLLKHLYTV